MGSALHTYIHGPSARIGTVSRARRRGRPRGPCQPDPTPAQAEFYSFLFDASARDGYQPTCRDICRHFGFTSTNSVTYYLRALRKKGWIGGEVGDGRGYRFLKRPDGGPFLGFAPITGERGN